MTENQTSLKKLLKGWMILCTFAVTLFIIFYGPYVLYEWIIATRGKDLKIIDACIDSGGTWHAEEKICVRAS